MRSFVLSLAFALLVLPLRAGDAPGASPSPSASPSPKEDKKKTSGANDPNFQFPVAEGVPIKGIKIPQYGDDGKLSMLFDAEVARKVDSDHIEMENLKIDSYSEDGKKMMVTMPKAVFNLEDRILKGNSGVTVKRDDLEVSGNAGEFYTKTRFAKVLGNVKMTIFSTQSLDRQ